MGRRPAAPKVTAVEATVTPVVEATKVVEAATVDLHAVPDESVVPKDDGAAKSEANGRPNDVVVQHVNGAVTMTLFCANVAVHFENGVAHVTDDVAYLLRKGGHIE